MLGKLGTFWKNSCLNTEAYCIMHGKDWDNLIEQSLTALDQPMLLGISTKRSRYSNRAVTMAWNTLTEQSHIFECFRLCNKFNKFIDYFWAKCWEK